MPKPLLRVTGKPLLQYYIEVLAGAGLESIVINHARLGRQIEDYFADGGSYGAPIRYSPER